MPLGAGWADSFGTRKASGTHPTGMFSCSLMFLLSFSFSLDVSGPLMTANVVNFTTI